jgi:hypothetical protein
MMRWGRAKAESLTERGRMDSVSLWLLGPTSSFAVAP